MRSKRPIDFGESALTFYGFENDCYKQFTSFQTRARTSARLKIQNNWKKQQFSHVFNMFDIQKIQKKKWKITQTSKITQILWLWIWHQKSLKIDYLKGLSYEKSLILDRFWVIFRNHIFVCLNVSDFEWLFSGERGVKSQKKWVTSFIYRPLAEKGNQIHVKSSQDLPVRLIPPSPG